jgi:cell division protease FtsH
VSNQNNHNDENNKKNRKKKTLIRIVSWIISAIIGISVFLMLNPVKTTEEQENLKTYNEFVAYVQEGTVEQVDYDPTFEFVFFKLKEDETVYQTYNPKVNTFKLEMLQHDVKVNEVQLDGNTFGDTMYGIIMLVIQYGLLMGMFMFIFKKMQGGTDDMSIETSSTNKLEDVAGLEEVKESVMTTIDMLKNPQKYEAAGARIAKGTLFYGPPGTGKTLLAKAIAGEAGVNFLAMSGSDFDNKYVGVGADKVRQVFAKAKKLAPCIIFIDELDAIGGKRTESDKSYERQTLNQLLACMDGFGSGDGVFIFAATNDVNSLDPALLRPGRFDSRFAVGLPDTAKDREAVIKLYMKNKKLDESVSIASLAKQTIGCSPATIETIINEAAIESVKNGGIINQQNIDEAFYRQIMDGHRKKNSERDHKEIETVAWHEAGHALVGYLQNEEVSKISIVPTTSGAGGVTIFNQKKMGMYSKAELENHVRTLYAGRNAEIILNGAAEVTTGASNDIHEATKCIKQMVSTYGMSKYGLLNLNEIKVSSSDLLEEYQSISKVLEIESMDLLRENMDMLRELAQTLIERETIDENELLALFASMDKKEKKENE